MNLNPEFLEKACMAFKLKDGTTLLIHEDDVKKIAMEIVMQASMSRDMKIVFQKDINRERILTLQKVLSEQRDMTPELKDKYLKQLLALLTKEPEIAEEVLFKVTEENNKSSPK